VRGVRQRCQVGDQPVAADRAGAADRGAGVKDRKPTTILAPKKDGAGTEKKEMADRIPGLHFWHAYAVLEVDEKAQRVKLFNPWGRDHPNGTGWMDIADIKTFFIEVDING
jgi:hypothetical protein